MGKKTQYISSLQGFRLPTEAEAIAVTKFMEDHYTSPELLKCFHQGKFWVLYGRVRYMKVSNPSELGHIGVMFKSIYGEALEKLFCVSEIGVAPRSRLMLVWQEKYGIEWVLTPYMLEKYKPATQTNAEGVEESERGGTKTE